MLNCPPVKLFHNTTANFRVHASVTFLISSGERPLPMVYFLKHLETSPFHWRWFCKCAINRFCHAFRHAGNIFKNGALIPSYLACSFVETSVLGLSCMRRALLTVNLHYFCLSRMRNASKSDFGKFQHKRFDYSQGKIKKAVLVVVVFHE